MLALASASVGAVVVAVLAAVVGGLPVVAAGAGVVEGVHRGPGVEVLVLEPGEGLVVLPESGVLAFRVLVYNESRVERVTLILCGEPIPMEPAGRMGGGTVYEARVELPPVEDVYSWSVRVVAESGVAETCTYKTHVVPAQVQAGGHVVPGVEVEPREGERSGGCPVAQPLAPSRPQTQPPGGAGGSDAGWGLEGWGLALTPLFAAAALAGLAARRGARGS